MTTRVVKTEFDRDLLLKLIKTQKLPFSVVVKKGNPRTVAQNKLQRLWINEIAEQLGDHTPEYIRGMVKLTHGVPILRAENEVFCEKYDRLIKHLPYATKIELMQEPIDFPVTRIMDTSQKTRFLDSIHKEFTEQGVVLTMPPDRY